MEEAAQALLLAVGTLGATLVAARKLSRGDPGRAKRKLDDLTEPERQDAAVQVQVASEEPARTRMPSAEEVGAARLALELAAERMGTNPELVERARAERERAERERDQMVGVLAFLPETQRQDALALASYEGEVYKVARLLDAGADKDGEASEALRADDLDGLTPLAAACQRGHLTVVNKLLEAGADPGKRVRGGVTPLMIAAEYNHVACVERLLEAPGVNVNAQANDGWTALHCAFGNWNPECVKLLLDKNVNVDARGGPEDITPLHASLAKVSGPDRNISNAEMQKCENCVRMLLNAGADKDAQDVNGNTPLMYAVWGKRRNLVEMFLGAECNVDHANTNGTTPLIFAACSNCLVIATMLLKAGADKTLRDGKGKTALRWAEERGHTAMAALLRDECTAFCAGLGAKKATSATRRGQRSNHRGQGKLIKK